MKTDTMTVARRMIRNLVAGYVRYSGECPGCMTYMHYSCNGTITPCSPHELTGWNRTRPCPYETWQKDEADPAATLAMLELFGSGWTVTQADGEQVPGCIVCRHAHGEHRPSCRLGRIIAALKEAPQ